MTREPDEPEKWQALDTYPNAMAAEADAAYLRSEKVAAKVELTSNLPGSGRARLWVDAALVHRAKWLLLKLDKVSDAELEYLATGKLPDPTDGEPR